MVTWKEAVLGKTEYVKCHHDVFQLMRTTDNQIVATCNNCQTPYTLDAVDGNLEFYSDLMDIEETSSEDKSKEESDEALPQRKIPKELQEKPVEDLIVDLVDFIKKESSGAIRFSDLTRIFWRMKGLPASFWFGDNDPIFELKRVKVEEAAKQRLG